jgi:predicted MPP superfamily phosphohydrolase
MPPAHPATYVLLAIGILGSLLALHAVFVAPRRLELVEVDAPIPGLDPAFDGYTIGVLSDIHQAALPGRAHTRRAVERVMAARPDLVALLGDYAVSFEHSFAASRWFYRRALPVLGGLLRPLAPPDGVVAVIGNHDYYYNQLAVREWLASLGARVLVNEHVVVRRGGACLAVAGLDDAKEGRPDLPAALAGLPARVPCVLLSHDPDGVLHLPPGARPALVLSGHTHGGQVVIPFYGAPVRWARITRRRSAHGWIPNPVAPLFVSKGVGSQVPLRFGAVPDVVVVRLRRQA